MGAPSAMFLEKLYNTTTDVLDEIGVEIENGKFGEGEKLLAMFGAVNWGHPPRCTEACYVLTYAGSYVMSEGLRVVVEEASPDAVGLQMEVQARLGKLGYVVEVVTEW